MELSLGSYNMCSVPPSVLAASALALAMRCLDSKSRLASVWSSTLQHYTQYDLPQLKPVIQQLAGILVTAPTAKLATVYQKYGNKKFMKISRSVRNLLSMFTNFLKTQNVYLERPSY